MKVTIIIPYKIDRGWLKQAIDSVPSDVQLILSQGNGNWPRNFNKALPQAQGDLIKFLHEDDILLPGAIEQYIKAFESPTFENVHFAHGNAREMYLDVGFYSKTYVPSIKLPTLNDLLKKNVIHSSSLIYRKEVFEKIGGFNEDPKMHSFEELEFNLRCLKARFNIGYIDFAFEGYRRHPKQIIRTCDSVSRKKNRRQLINSYL